MGDATEAECEHRGMASDAWASSTGLLQMAYLIGAEVQKLLQGDQAHSEGQVCLIDLKTLKSSWHSFLPDPLCPVCGQLPDDSQTLLEFHCSQVRKSVPDSFRCRSIG